MNAFSRTNRFAVSTSRRAQRISRHFRPSADGLESRLALSGTAATVGLGTPPPMADIVVDNLTVQDLGNNTFKVTATLTNELATPVPSTGLSVPPKGSTATTGVDYPGGGIFRIARTTGGTTIVNPPSDTAPTIQDPVRTLAAVRIPAIAFNHSIQLSAVTQGRAIFSASASQIVSPLGQTSPFPDANLHDNFRSVNTLTLHRTTLNSLSLSTIQNLATPLQNIQMSLYGANSNLTIPNVVSHRFAIPLQKIVVTNGIVKIENDYLVNNLVSVLVPESNALSYENGGLMATVHFADNAHALKSYNTLLPDIGVEHLRVKIFLPLKYSAGYQYFFLGTPRVDVTGDWQTSSPFGDLYNLVIPGITKSISDGVTASVLAGKGVMEHLLNQSIHDLASGGRIASATISNTDAIINIETPS
jgi:hypothetical protein